MRIRNIQRLLSCVLIAALFVSLKVPAPVWAAGFDPSQVMLRETSSGLTQPLAIVNAGDGSGRLFIVERAGRIRILDQGTLLATPFLDIDNIVNSTNGEQGLLALAFHPNYETNGFFYTAHTADGGALVLSRFTRSANNPNLANPNSGLTLITIPHPTHTNHNGGTLAFGPDGYLYWSTGDGGGGGDPFNNAQNLNSLLGKILRLDVDHSDPGKNYAIPASNPFYNMQNRRGEIWAYGLRNPWRLSFDRQTGDLFIADVGQNNLEEINFQPAASPGGENYGWPIMEGTQCYNSPQGCDKTGKVLPITEYDHSLGCSVTGGYLYRGSRYPAMNGRYFFADYCSGRLFSLYKDSVQGWVRSQVADTPYLISTFGQDEQGELYLSDYREGKIYQICYGDEIYVVIQGVRQSPSYLCKSENARRSFSNVNDGPVKIVNTDGDNIVASQRVIFGGVSSSEMMGLPKEQLSNQYLFPYYNNTAMQSQLRISNLGSVPTTITVYLADQQIDSFELAAGAAWRGDYPGQNNGPLRVTSSAANILPTVRVLYGSRSYSELMGYPVGQLDNDYWYPIYDNVNTSSQLRVSNVDDGPTTITVLLAGQQIDQFDLSAGQAARKSYPGRNSGPLQVSSSATNILTTIRVLHNRASYSELSGLPAGQLSQAIWFPVYDNANQGSELRVANVGGGSTTINVYAAGQKIDAFSLSANTAARKSYARNTGPLHVVSSAEPIVSSVRTLYTTPGFSSLNEMMGLPGSQLSVRYFFPWYNNSAMKSEIRFAVP